jgi:cytochrome P450
MTATERNEVYFDPFDWDIRCDPYPVYQRLRDDAPLYYNEVHDFYVVSRFEDVERAVVERETFISGYGSTIDAVQAKAVVPPGLFIAEDAPANQRHRAMISAFFTPRNVASLEPKTRQFCREVLDELDGVEQFDFVADLAAEVPMRVIGALLGIPDSDHDSLRQRFDSTMQAAYDSESEPFAALDAGAAVFGEYVDWKEKNPTDDLMTDLMTREFEDREGVRRKIPRDQLNILLLLIASGGSDTTNRLMGWMGKILSDHPDQRRAVIEDRSLAGGAVEESLRYESPNYHVARYVAKDTEFHGQPLPEGSALVAIPGAANHDERVFPDPDTFDVRRTFSHHLSFGYGQHFCIGAALARLEARILLEELLDRIPEWHVDDEHARLTPGFITRGWETLPVTVGAN